MSLTRWIAAFDTHGDCIDPGASKAFKDFCRSWKPSIRIHGGDAWDLRFLRRSASDDEKADSVHADYTEGCAFMEWFKPTVWLRGNHDERLWDALDASTNAALRQLSGQWIDYIQTTLKGCVVYPYCKRRGVHELGDFRFIHGYSHGIGAIRKAALTYGNVVMGHVHRLDAQRVETLDRAWGYGAGCLCRLDFPYNRGTIGTLAQEHGFVYGYVTPGGRTVVYQAQSVDGKWYYPSEGAR